MSKSSKRKREKAAMAATAPAILYSDLGPSVRHIKGHESPLVMDEVANESSDIRRRARAKYTLVIDEYKKRKLITVEQHTDALRLAGLYWVATRNMALLCHYAEYIGGGLAQNALISREDAWKEYNRAMHWVGPIANGEVRRVCADNHHVGGKVSMEIFRRGLDRLSDFPWRAFRENNA